jgi:hypothetical protein
MKNTLQTPDTKIKEQSLWNWEMDIEVPNIQNS